MAGLRKQLAKTETASAEELKRVEESLLSARNELETMKEQSTVLGQRLDEKEKNQGKFEETLVETRKQASEGTAGGKHGSGRRAALFPGSQGSGE